MPTSLKDYFSNNESFIGYTGSTGFTGSIGFTGSQGPAGGYTGSQGTVGYTGSQGDLSAEQAIGFSIALGG